MEAVLIFPHQLFEHHPQLSKERLVLLVEHPRFFSDFTFHKKKLIFHRASLKSYEKLLKSKGYRTLYVEEELEKTVKTLNLSKLYTLELDDAALKFEFASSLTIDLSPGFLSTVQEFQQLYRRKSSFRFETFYIDRRKKENLLLDEEGKPLHGKWSMDSENRKKAPKGLSIPMMLPLPETDEVKEAQSYVRQKYSHHPGIAERFNYPTTHALAKKALQEFLTHRFPLFGDYEDAILRDESVLFHSVLSPLLNTGLLTPAQVIEETLKHAQKSSIPFNSLEGFVRQVIGWREYVRGIYHTIGGKQRKGNFFKHQRDMPSSFYTGTTGILPIDETIQKLNEHGYLHHIERLMVMGNFFLLCEIKPDHIYKWFMELFIDSYDWVMVPNVYGMSQYADGGLMTTKPYMSGSNYILKMSNYPKGSWCEIWDGLFWRFMIKNEEFFASQPRLSVLTKMAQEKKKDCPLLEKAENFLSELTGANS